MLAIWETSPGTGSPGSPKTLQSLELRWLISTAPSTAYGQERSPRWTASGRGPVSSGARGGQVGERCQIGVETLADQQVGVRHVADDALHIRVAETTVERCWEQRRRAVLYQGPQLTCEGVERLGVHLQLVIAHQSPASPVPTCCASATLSTVATLTQPVIDRNLALDARCLIRTLEPERSTTFRRRGAIALCQAPPERRRCPAEPGLRSGFRR